MGRQDQPDSLVNMCLNTPGIIDIAGHSRGVIGLLIATLLVSHGVDSTRVKVTLYGTPRIGDSDFRRAYTQMLGFNTTTIIGAFDPVPHIPFWSDHHGEIIKLYQLKLIRHSIEFYHKALINTVEI